MKATTIRVSADTLHKLKIAKAKSNSISYDEYLRGLIK